MADLILMGGKLQLYRRGAGKTWHCSASVGGKQRRCSTKQESLDAARHVAEDWYLTLQGKKLAGTLDVGPTFRKAAEQFVKEYVVITEGERSEKWTESHAIRLRLHLVPFFGDLPLAKVTPGKVQEYRVHRMTNYKEPNPESKRLNKPSSKPPSRSTLHDEVVTLRMVLKTAIRHGWLEHLPDLSPPYKSQGKVAHRPWFSPEEYSNFMRRRGPTPRSRPTAILSGMPNRFMTSSCSWPTLAFGRTRPSTFSTET